MLPHIIYTWKRNTLMYTYMHKRAHIRMYVYTQTHTHIHTQTRLRIYICIYTFAYTHTHIYIYIKRKRDRQRDREREIRTSLSISVGEYKRPVLGMIIIIDPQEFVDCIHWRGLWPLPEKGVLCMALNNILWWGYTFRVLSDGKISWNFSLREENTN